VHTTQFAIREPRFGLFEPVLSLAAEEMNRADGGRKIPMVRIGGVYGETAQAMREAGLLRDRGYHIALVSPAALTAADDDQLVAHCRAVADILPIMGFYLQPAVGGRVLGYSFWRRLAEISDLVAIKIAPFNRYQTIDVIRAVADSGRDELALYTGNDDNIVFDLLTPYRFCVNGRQIERRMVGGLLGHWAVWTQRAVQLLSECHALVRQGSDISPKMLRRAVEVTDCNAAFFDAAHHFAGCIAGIHEVLRRQGLLQGNWCLDPRETLSPGQYEAIDRVYREYPHLSDDDFVAEHRDDWLK
jgi:dihydrodipicolinate synthase/N-acetylneuraminate lyase